VSSATLSTRPLKTEFWPLERRGRCRKVGPCTAKIYDRCLHVGWSMAQPFAHLSVRPFSAIKLSDEWVASAAASQQPACHGPRHEGHPVRCRLFSGSSPRARTRHPPSARGAREALLQYDTLQLRAHDIDNAPDRSRSAVTPRADQSTFPYRKPSCNSSTIRCTPKTRTRS
jgi:hypothetical protein